MRRCARGASVADGCERDAASAAASFHACSPLMPLCLFFFAFSLLPFHFRRFADCFHYCRHF
jgi:hypothetical protein